VARESAVTTRHEVTLICDKCKTETNEAICWAHLDIKAPDVYSVDLCSDCWLEVRDIIWGSKKLSYAVKRRMEII
jgi:hypothetical protein